MRKGSTVAVRPINLFLVLQGVFALIASILLVVWPGHSAVVFSYLVGFWFLADAALALIASVRRKSGLALGHTILSALLGILILAAPNALLGFLVVVMSIAAVLFGAGVILVSVLMRSLGVRSWWLGLVLGIAAVFAGFLMPVFPADTITIGMYLAAFLLAIYGVLSLMLARRITTTFRAFRTQNGQAQGWTASGRIGGPGGRGGRNGRGEGPQVIEGEVVDDD